MRSSRRPQFFICPNSVYFTYSLLFHFNCSSITAPPFLLSKNRNSLPPFILSLSSMTHTTPASNYFPNQKAENASGVKHSLIQGSHNRCSHQPLSVSSLSKSCIFILVLPKQLFSSQIPPNNLIVLNKARKLFLFFSLLFKSNIFSFFSEHLSFSPIWMRICIKFNSLKCH